MRNIAIAFNLAIALAFVAGCGPTAREKAVTAAYATVHAVSEAEERYSADHQLQIVRVAPDKPTAEHELADFQQKRETLDKLIVVAFKAIAAAAALQDVKSLDDLKAAIGGLMTEAAAFLPQKGTI